VSDQPVGGQIPSPVGSAGGGEPTFLSNQPHKLIGLDPGQEQDGDASRGGVDPRGSFIHILSSTPLKTNIFLRSHPGELKPCDRRRNGY
jgi:hypothetical protein